MNLTGEILALLSLTIWLYLFFFHGWFWRSQPELSPAMPSAAPVVDIIVPARNEAVTIQAVIASLLAQDYPGTFSVTLVDDDSSDGTAHAAGAARNLSVISGRPKPSGWSGKLWALRQGIEETSAPVLLFTDGDVVHDSRHLSALVARLLNPACNMVSEMVRLSCTSAAERLLVPAYVYFFQLLYPFGRVNDPRSSVAAAAGGTVLVRRNALEKAGGIDAIKSALIDDVALAKIIKASGPIYLGHSGLATSLRAYSSVSDIWEMITRTAFTQLRHSAALLLLTVVGLSLVFLSPLWAALFAHGWSRAAGVASYALLTIGYMPTLRRYRQSRALALALPLIALFYMGATIASAINYWSGRGTVWKNRDYDANSCAGP
jgi:hopene-associated glycosyltransferase HpnB